MFSVCSVRWRAVSQLCCRSWILDRWDEQCFCPNFRCFSCLLGALYALFVRLLVPACLQGFQVLSVSIPWRENVFGNSFCKYHPVEPKVLRLGPNQVRFCCVVAWVVLEPSRRRRYVTNGVVGTNICRKYNSIVSPNAWQRQKLNFVAMTSRRFRSF